VHDRELLEALDHLEVIAVQQTVWRVAWKDRDVLQGGTGGRWTPARGPEALYTSETEDGALAEVYHLLSQAPVFSSSDKLCYAIEVQTQRTIRLDSADALASVGLTQEKLRSRDLSPCQAVGAAARLMEFDGIWVPSMRWNCRNLVLFPDLLSNPKALQPQTGLPVNWAAWREREDVRRLLERKI
jgi:RES domain-containing protein